MALQAKYHYIFWNQAKFGKFIFTEDVGEERYVEIKNNCSLAVGHAVQVGTYMGPDFPQAMEQRKFTGAVFLRLVLGLGVWAECHCFGTNFVSLSHLSHAYLFGMTSIKCTSSWQHSETRTGILCSRSISSLFILPIFKLLTLAFNAVIQFIVSFTKTFSELI